MSFTVSRRTGALPEAARKAKARLTKVLAAQQALSQPRRQAASASAPKQDEDDDGEEAEAALAEEEERLRAAVTASGKKARAQERAAARPAEVPSADQSGAQGSHNPERAEDERSARGDRALEVAEGHLQAALRQASADSLEARFREMAAHVAQMESRLAASEKARLAAEAARNEAEETLRLQAEERATLLAEQAEQAEQARRAAGPQGDPDDDAHSSEEGSGDDDGSARAPANPGAHPSAVPTAAGETARPPGGPGQSPPGRPATTITIQGPPRPPNLSWEKKATQVADWTDRFDEWFEAAGISDDATRVQQALQSCDPQMMRWWRLSAQAKLPASWAEFVKALREEFILENDDEVAAKELLVLRMRPEETNHDYFLRVIDLQLRAKYADDNHLVLLSALGGFARARYPSAHAAAAEEVRMKRITSISELKRYLAIKIRGEPPRPEPQRPNSSYHSSASSSKPARLNAATTRAVDEESEEDVQSQLRAQLEDVQRALKALQQSGSGRGGRGTSKRCARCGETTHLASECKLPDNRECYKCHKKGHIARECKEGGAQPPLNREARQ